MAPLTSRGAPLSRLQTLPKLFLVLLLLFAGLCVDDSGAVRTCPEENLEEVDHTGFFAKASLTKGVEVKWDTHRIGWGVAGFATVVASTASITNIYLHCTNYNKPLEQRQIVRILLMPLIYSTVSFFAFRYYRQYVYYAVIRDTYEAFVLAAFLILCLLYVGRSPLEQQEVMKEKEKTPLVTPFCCFRYRPSKPYFLIATKWSVLQYVILRPLISASAIITDTQKVFCASSFSPHFANLWLTLLTFISATIALYGLLIIYHLAKEDMVGHRPMMKFMSIKIAVFLVFYQGFVLSFLDHEGAFKATHYWSRSNIADGVNALVTTIEMAIVGVFQLFAYPSSEYKALIKGSAVNRNKTPWQNFLHSQDYRDFGRDIIIAVRFFSNHMRGRPQTHGTQAASSGMDFQAAFGLDPSHCRVKEPVEIFTTHEDVVRQSRARMSVSKTEHYRPTDNPVEDGWPSPLSSAHPGSFDDLDGDQHEYESIKLSSLDLPRKHFDKPLQITNPFELEDSDKQYRTDEEDEFEEIPTDDDSLRDEVRAGVVMQRIDPTSQELPGLVDPQTRQVHRDQRQE